MGGFVDRTDVNAKFSGAHNSVITGLGLGWVRASRSPLPHNSRSGFGRRELYRFGGKPGVDRTVSTICLFLEWK